MNPSGREANKARSSRRTKAELQKALVEAHERLAEQAEELTAQENELEKARAELENLRETRESNSIQGERNELREARQQQRAVEERSRGRTRMAKKSPEKIPSNGETADSLPDEFLAARSTFRIDLYLSQGHIQGRIMHPLTKDETAFKELDAPTIKTFLSKHLPRSQQCDTQSQPAATPKKELPPQDKTAATDDEGLRLCEFAVIPAGASAHRNLVQHNQPFAMRLIVDPVNLIPKQGAPLKYKITTYAKRLEYGKRQFTGGASGHTSSADAFTAKVTSLPLPRGTYRLEAITTLITTTEHPEQVRTLVRNNLIRVC
jgi:hypothetical protein